MGLYITGSCSPYALLEDLLAHETVEHPDEAGPLLVADLVEHLVNLLRVVHAHLNRAE